MPCHGYAASYFRSNQAHPKERACLSQILANRAGSKKERAEATRLGSSVALHSMTAIKAFFWGVSQVKWKRVSSTPGLTMPEYLNWWALTNKS